MPFRFYGRFSFIFAWSLRTQHCPSILQFPPNRPPRPPAAALPDCGRQPTGRSSHGPRPSPSYLHSTAADPTDPKPRGPGSAQSERHGTAAIAADVPRLASPGGGGGGDLWTARPRRSLTSKTPQTLRHSLAHAAASFSPAPRLRPERAANRRRRRRGSAPRCRGLGGAARNRRPDFDRHCDSAALREGR